MALNQCLVLENVMMPTTEIRYIWTIPNVTNVCLLCDTVVSPVFPPNASIIEQYYMKFSACNYDSRRNRSVTLSFFTKNGRAVRGFIRCKILTSNGENERATKGMINKDAGGYEMYSWDICSLFLDLLTKYPTILSNGSLTLSCTITEMNIEGNMFYDESQILEDIIKVHGMKPNVIVKTRSKDIPCHKAALCNSKVFEKMFEVDMKENNEMVVDMTHIEDPGAVEDLIYYLYVKQKPTNIEESCDALLPLADLHELNDLKAKCELEMVNKLDIDNALELCQKAQTYNADWLKKHCILFIRGNLKDVKKSEACKTLPSNFIADLLLEIYSE